MVLGFTRFKEFVLDLVFPNECLGCGGVAEKILWCGPCETALPFFPYLYCPGCGRRAPTGVSCQRCRVKTGLAGLIVMLPYASPPVREAVLELKYRGVSSYAKPLAQALAGFIAKHTPPLASFLPEHTMAIPVPLATTRLKERGFNQAEAIAGHLATLLKLPLAVDLLKRVKDTKPQTEIKDKDERRANVANAFAVSGLIRLTGKTALLVDDVYTTGATMRECAKALRRAGTKAVWGVAVARG